MSEFAKWAGKCGYCDAPTTAGTCPQCGHKAGGEPPIVRANREARETIPRHLRALAGWACDNEGHEVGLTVAADEIDRLRAALDAVCYRLDQYEPDTGGALDVAWGAIKSAKSV